MKPIKLISFLDTVNNSPVHLRQAGANDVQVQIYMEEKITPINDLLNRVAGEHDKVLGDAELSDVGRKNKLNEIDRKAWKQLDDMFKQVDTQYSKYLDDVRSQQSLSEYEGSGDSIVDYLMQQELRNWLSTLEPRQVQQLYNDAIENGDNEMLVHTIENNPLQRFKPLIPSEKIAEGRQIRMERENPETFADMRIVESMKSVFGGAIQKSRQMLIDAGYEEGRPKAPKHNEK